jgi:hypothetical protein
MPTQKIGRPHSSSRSRSTLGPRGRIRGAPRALQDEMIARAAKSSSSRTKALAESIDSASSPPTADVMAAFSTKHVS